MTAKTITKGILSAIGIIIALLILLWFIYKILPVIAYIVIAAVVALIGRPVVYFLRLKLLFPNTLAVVVTMILILGVLTGIFALFVPLIAEQGKNLSLLDIDELQRSLNKLYWQISLYFRAPPEVVHELIEETDIERNMLEGYDLGFIPRFLNSILDMLGSFSIGLFSVIFISFFFLKDRKLLENGILMFVPVEQHDKTRTSIHNLNVLLSRYFVGLLLQILILFSIYTLVLFFVGIENAILIAFLCALFNIIPYIGPIIGGVIMVVLTMTSNLGADFSAVILPKTLWVLLGLLIGQLVDNFFSQPYIFSSSVKSHPLEIFLIIIIAGLLFGIPGMILAVPGYTAIKVVLKQFLSENRIVRRLTHKL